MARGDTASSAKVLSHGVSHNYRCSGLHPCCVEVAAHPRSTESGSDWRIKGQRDGSGKIQFRNASREGGKGGSPKCRRTIKDGKTVS